MDKKLLMDIIQWDTVNWGNCIRLWRNYIQSPPPKLHCIEIGANKGGLSLWAALNGHNIICSDLENPFAIAKPLHDKYKVTEKIEYQAVNILDITYKEYFDIVFLKSILAVVGRNNHKDLQDRAIESIYQSLKPGGKFLFAENLAATKLHSFARKRFISWGSSVRYLQIGEMIELLKLFNRIEYQTFGFFGVFGRTEKQKRLLGKIDILLNRIIPKQWNYLIIGVATK